MNKNLTNIITQIIRKFNPDKIILFGSFAYGNPDDNSDIDLLLIMDYKGSARKKATEVLQSIDYHYPLDLMVRQMAIVQHRIQKGDFFLKEIMEKGKVLYDRNIS